MLEAPRFPVAKEPSKKLANVGCHRRIFKQNPQVKAALAVAVGQEGMKAQTDQNVVPRNRRRFVRLGVIDLTMLVDIAAHPE